MIDIEYLRENVTAVKSNLARRGIKAVDIDHLLEVDQRWRAQMSHIDALRAKQNAANSAIAAAAVPERETLINDMRIVSQQLKKAETEVEVLAHERDHLWRLLPNLIADDVPEGDEDAFVVLKAEPAQTPDVPVYAKSYLELVDPTGVDMERGSKVSGSGFAYLKGDVARLQFALVRLALDQLMPEGFIPVIPPVLISEAAMAGMGYLDRHPEEIYQTQDHLFLTGTSEQAIGPMHMNEVLDAASLPLRYVAYSSCFRREAGSHGKDVKGIMRVHQFDKVEMFSFTLPEKSTEEHEFLLQQQERLMQALDLPYRVIKLAAQDTGMPSSKTYDIETWIPSEGRYRETHSTSNTTDYQARRLNIRTKTEAGMVKVHMLNGTAFAIGRILIAILENHQQSDGTIQMPEVLQPYLPFTQIEGNKKS